MVTKDKPIMGIDLDNTLADTTGAVRLLLKERHGIDIVKEQWTSYHIWECMPQITKDIVLPLFKEAWEVPAKIQLLHQEVPAIIEKLKDRFSVYIVTSTFASDESILHWLDDNGLMFNAVIHAINDKEKISMVQHGRIKYLLDDNFELLRNLGNGTVPILLRQPWNERYIASGSAYCDGMTVVDGWHELLRVTDRLAMK